VTPGCSGGAGCCAEAAALGCGDGTALGCAVAGAGVDAAPERAGCAGAGSGFSAAVAADGGGGGGGVPGAVTDFEAHPTITTPAAMAARTTDLIISTP
jgi:hypothetical protein